MRNPTLPLAVAELVQSDGCVGSMQWGIDTGRAFDIEGIWKYGRSITNADSHKAAIEIVLAWDCQWNDEAFTFIAPELLTVYKYGPKYTYMRSERMDFTIRQGIAVEVRNA